jgi:carbonic anhydrase
LSAHPRATGANAGRPSDPDPQRALDALRAGNQRYAGGRSVHPRLDADRRREVAGGQKPFALVIGCVDSRVAPELIFDQGLGDILTARMPGSLVNDEMVGTAQFSVAELGAPLIMVLGHSSCGAVTAAIEALESGRAAPGHVDTLVDGLAPAVRESEAEPGEPVENAVRRNVALGVGRLREAEILDERIRRGDLMVVGAYYDLGSGVVEIMS